MQVHIVTEANRHIYENEFDQYLFERHRVYAEELGWVATSPDRRERDAYDTAHAVHFIGIDDGRVVAASRLVPTSEPHLLSEVFPHLCTRSGGPIRDPRVAEWTRGFIVKDNRKAGDFRIHFQFCHAIMDYALQEGLTQLGGIQRTYWLTMWQRMGWSVRIEGEPVQFEDGPWFPAYFDVTADALAGAARWAKLNGSILVRKGPQVPFVRSTLGASESAEVPHAA